jgi:hypothetical protein
MRLAADDAGRGSDVEVGIGAPAETRWVKVVGKQFTPILVEERVEIPRACNPIVSESCLSFNDAKPMEQVEVESRTAQPNWLALWEREPMIHIELKRPRIDSEDSSSRGNDERDRTLQGSKIGLERPARSLI